MIAYGRRLLRRVGGPRVLLTALARRPVTPLTLVVHAFMDADVVAPAWAPPRSVGRAGHLGLLEERRTLGWANVITVTRANLSAHGARLGTWIPVLAVLSDIADGVLARRSRRVRPRPHPSPPPVSVEASPRGGRRARRRC